MGEFVTITAGDDSGTFGSYVARPASGSGPGIVVIQEIFGVNSHIKSVADGYAADGYLAIAPAMYDRLQRNYETGYSPEEIQAGLAIMQKLDWKNTMTDVDAAVKEAGGGGKVGIVGYCWGGTVAWVAAARTKGLACSVPYYGGGIPNFAEEGPKVPMMCNFGEQDQSPTPEQAKAAVAKHPAIVAHFYAAGHGFNCDQRGSYNAEASKLARTRTLEFFRKHIG